jgi:hypothetical protein
MQDEADLPEYPPVRINSRGEISVTVEGILNSRAGRRNIRRAAKALDALGIGPGIYPSRAEKEG